MVDGDTEGSAAVAKRARGDVTVSALEDILTIVHDERWMLLSDVANEPVHTAYGTRPYFVDAAKTGRALPWDYYRGMEGNQNAKQHDSVKRCPGCQKVYPRHARYFYPNKARGFESQCRPCYRAGRRARYHRKKGAEL